MNACLACGPSVSVSPHASVNPNAQRDTRRKILIGAAVLAAVDHGGVPVLDTQRALLQWLDDRLTRPHDRAVFDLAKRDPGT